MHAWATLGEFRAEDSDIAFWNPADALPALSLANATSGNRSRILAPTMAEQIYAAKLLTPGAAGHEVTLHAFRNDIDEHTVVGHALIQPDGIARLTQSRPGEAVEELVAAVELQGQQFFANTPIQWVIAPPKATFVITRLDPRTVMVVTRLTRDLDPTDRPIGR